MADAFGVSCPANWTPGQDVIVPAPTTTQGAEERVRERNLALTDWYLARRHVA
jgi:peroxiredoxin (alkyl hydroperoxide reductase subunit C)